VTHTHTRSSWHMHILAAHDIYIIIPNSSPSPRRLAASPAAGVIGRPLPASLRPRPGRGLRRSLTLRSRSTAAVAAGTRQQHEHGSSRSTAAAGARQQQEHGSSRSTAAAGARQQQEHGSSRNTAAAGARQQQEHGSGLRRSRGRGRVPADVMEPAGEEEEQACW
jgi:hypothetical protein